MPKLIGRQKPRLDVTPEGDAARGELAVEFAEFCGLTLLPWQQDLLRDMCRTVTTLDDDTGEEITKWAAKEVGVVVARQNGKGEVLVARELAGIYLFHEHTILHTAHLMDTAVDAQKRLWEVIESNEDLMYWGHDDASLCPRLTTANGKEAIHFPHLAEESGRAGTIYFRTRTKKTGRGLTIDLLIYDECFNLPTEVFGAMDSTTAAVKNGQKVFISSPVNRFEHDHGQIFSAKRWAAIDGVGGTLFREWSMDEDDDPLDPDVWAKCNPSLGPVTQLDEIASSAASAAKSEDLMEKFRVESLGSGNWFPRDGDSLDSFVPVVDFERWYAMEGTAPALPCDSAVAIDVDIGAEYCSMVAALRRRDGGVHLKLSPLVGFDRDAAVAAITDVVDKNDPLSVVADFRGAASTLEKELERAGLDVSVMSARKVANAYQLFLQLVAEGRLSHDGDERWQKALHVVQEREMKTGGKAVQRNGPDGCPLVAAALAVYGLEQGQLPDVEKPRVRPMVAPLTVKRPKRAWQNNF